MAYAVNPPDPTDVVGRRILAFLIDFALVAALWLAVVTPFVFANLETAPTSAIECGSSGSSISFDDPQSTSEQNPSICFSSDGETRYVPVDKENQLTVLSYGSSLLVGLLNNVVLQGTRGASLGKLAMGLRVIREDGRRANVGWNLLRWGLFIIGTICCCIGWVIDLVMVLTTKGHRRVGDYAAGTFVVGKEAEGTPPQIAGVTTAAVAPLGYPQPAGYPPQAGPPGAPGVPPAWAPPPGGPDGAPQLPPVQPATPSADGPIWDEARDAYIQYDRELGEWVQWDDQGNRWRSIDR